jgi:beta-lactamase class A
VFRRRRAEPARCRVFALSISDNTAADLLFDRVGLDNVRLLVRELGLTATRIVGSPRYVVQTMAEDIGAVDAADFARRYPELSARQVFATRAVDPRRTTASTPRDMTRLLMLIGQHGAGAPEACRWVRELMLQQVNWHRLGAAFPPEVTVWSKTGSLLSIRNEVGVVEYPGGDRYAVACSPAPTRSPSGYRRSTTPSATPHGSPSTTSVMTGRTPHSARRCCASAE